MKNHYDVSLILQKKFAEEIISKTKKREYRDYSDFYIARFFEACEATDRGAMPVSKDEKKYMCPRKIEKIRFQIGYSKKHIIAECLGWGIFTKRMCRGLCQDAVNRSLTDEQAKYTGGPSLLDVVSQEYDVQFLPDDEPFFIFELGKVLEDKSELSSKV